VWTPDGKMKLPTGYREWVFIGSPLTPNALNNGKAAFPEFHNVYVERSNFDAYMKTGTFPEGTVLVKELVLLQKPTFPDGSQTEPSGRGFFDRRVIATRSCFGLSRTESATPECRLSAKLKRQTTFGIW
jgi:hypothetical protein